MNQPKTLIGGMGAIRRHLFVLAPNNSGSTFLARALALSPGAWSLPREGQHVPGFAGPSTRSSGAGLLWAATPEGLARFADPSAYDWEQNRKAWHFQAAASQPEASVLVVSSPPFLLLAQALKAHFANARFLILVRNPYAVVEGIVRGTPSQADPVAQAAATHVIAALQHQRRNVHLLGDLAFCFTYEDMCRNPASVAAGILALEPDLRGVDLARKIAVKGHYDEVLRDMNDQQIARLTPATLAAINQVFDAHRPLLDSFGYARLTA